MVTGIHRAERGHRLADLRRHNHAAVVDALRERGPRTLHQLAAATRLSRPTLTAILEDLVERGWATPTEPAEQTSAAPRRGRPARAYRFRAEAGHVAGADIGQHRTSVVITDLAGQPVADVRLETGPDLDATERLIGLQQALTDATERAGLPLDGSGVAALAVGVPGIVGPTGRVRKSLIIPAWSGVDLAARLTELTGIDTVVENDANLGAIGERWAGAAQLTDDVVYIHAGHRVSAGLLLGGRLHRGRTGAAGEVGSLSALGWGSLDSTVIEAAARAASDRTPEPRAPEVGASEVGTTDASFDRFIDRLAEGLGLVIHTVDPEVVVIGGGLAAAGEVLVNPLRTALTALVWDVPEIRVSRLAADATRTGAVRLALDRIATAIT